jgi:two-component system, cell cycle sensor histidine kinase and response regulator CckA
MRSTVTSKANYVATATCASKKDTVTYNLAPDLPTTRADASQIHQVILNLVINASDALRANSSLIAISICG